MNCNPCSVPDRILEFYSDDKALLDPRGVLYQKKNLHQRQSLNPAPSSTLLTLRETIAFIWRSLCDYIWPRQTDFYLLGLKTDENGSKRLVLVNRQKNTCFQKFIKKSNKESLENIDLNIVSIAKHLNAKWIGRQLYHVPKEKEVLWEQVAKIATRALSKGYSELWDQSPFKLTDTEYVITSLKNGVGGNYSVNGEICRPDQILSLLSSLPSTCNLDLFLKRYLGIVRPSFGFISPKSLQAFLDFLKLFPEEEYAVIVRDMLERHWMMDDNSLTNEPNPEKLAEMAKIWLFLYRESGCHFRFWRFIDFSGMRYPDIVEAFELLKPFFNLTEDVCFEQRRHFETVIRCVAAKKTFPLSQEEFTKLLTLSIQVYIKHNTVNGTRLYSDPIETIFQRYLTYPPEVRSVMAECHAKLPLSYSNCLDFLEKLSQRKNLEGKSAALIRDEIRNTVDRFSSFYRAHLADIHDLIASIPFGESEELFNDLKSIVKGKWDGENLERLCKTLSRMKEEKREDCVAKLARFTEDCESNALISSEITEILRYFYSLSTERRDFAGQIFHLFRKVRYTRYRIKDGFPFWRVQKSVEKISVDHQTLFLDCFSRLTSHSSSTEFLEEVFVLFEYLSNNQNDPSKILKQISHEEWLIYIHHIQILKLFSLSHLSSCYLINSERWELKDTYLQDFLLIQELCGSAPSLAETWQSFCTCHDYSLVEYRKEGFPLFIRLEPLKPSKPPHRMLECASWLLKEQLFEEAFHFISPSQGPLDGVSVLLPDCLKGNTDLNNFALRFIRHLPALQNLFKLSQS